MMTLAQLCQSASPSGRLRQGRPAQVLVGVAFAAAFAAVGGRMALLVSGPPQMTLMSAMPATQQPVAKNRPDIVDRNGRLMATDIRAYWFYANPQAVVDADDAAEKATALFPDLNAAALAVKFRDKTSRFEWVKRGLTPRQAEAVQRLGVPGFTIVNAVQRVYPAGNAAAHVLGVTNVDNEGISGIERYIDTSLSDYVAGSTQAARPIVKLSIDLGVQHALTDELQAAKVRYRAKAVMGVLLDANSGEVLASASLPDYDPNRRDEALVPDRQNRILNDTYELGSVFKAFTVAMALDAGAVKRADRFNSAAPLNVGRFRLRDPHAHGGSMSVDDIFVHSSNTGAARIAMAAGMSRQRQFLRAMGLFDRLETEAGNSPMPSYPKVWRPANAMTISYGHGIAVPPLRFAAAAATLVNGGYEIKPTFLIRSDSFGRRGTRLVKPETSAAMRDLMAQVVTRGTGRRAAVTGLDVGGKTGTALKAKNGVYTKDVMNTFVAAFPISQPKYLLMVTLDEPQAEKPGTSNEAAYNAAPTAGAIIARVAPMLDVQPARQFDEAVSASYERPKVAVSEVPLLRNEDDEPRGSDQRHRAPRPSRDGGRDRDYGADRG